MPSVPTTTATASGRWLLGRLGGRLGHGDLGRRWRRLGRRNRFRGLGCNRLGRRRNRLNWLGRRRRRASWHTLWRSDGGHGGWRVARLQRGVDSRASLFTLAHACGLGQRLAHHRLRLANQWQRHWLGRARELDGSTLLAVTQRQLGLGGRRFGRGLVAFLGHQYRGRNGNHDHSGQCEHMFFRHLEPHGWSLGRRAAGDHGFDQSVTGDLIDVARPAVRVFMDIGDLFTAEHLDALTSPFQALFQVLAGFFFTVGRKLDDVETFFLDIELIQPGNQRWLTEQKHVRTPFRNPRRQLQQRLECRLVELFRIVHQQIHFLPGQCQLHHLRQDRLHLGLGHTQLLRDLREHTGGVAGAAGRHHHTLHSLLVGAGHQGLAK
ncbi:hypothetical protein D9M71_308910 [compost metagenome]